MDTVDGSDCIQIPVGKYETYINIVIHNIHEQILYYQKLIFDILYINNYVVFGVKCYNIQRFQRVSKYSPGDVTQPSGLAAMHVSAVFQRSNFLYSSATARA